MKLMAAVKLLADDRLWSVVKLAGALLAVTWCSHSLAEAEPLTDEQLAGVDGGDGITIAVHLEMSSNLLAGFNDGDKTTYLLMEDSGGVMDLWGMSIDAGRLPDDSGGYIRVGMPAFIGFTEFGLGPVSVQATPDMPLPAATNYGQLRLNGTGAMTGNLFLWAD